MTYSQRELTAVIGPLAERADPHTYDLCAQHATVFKVPMGWELINLIPVDDSYERQSDMEKMIDAVVGSTSTRAGSEPGAPVTDVPLLRLVPTADRVSVP